MSSMTEDRGTVTPPRLAAVAGPFQRASKRDSPEQSQRTLGSILPPALVLSLSPPIPWMCLPELSNPALVQKTRTKNDPTDVRKLRHCSASLTDSDSWPRPLLSRQHTKGLAQQGCILRPALRARPGWASNGSRLSWSHGGGVGEYGEKGGSGVQWLYERGDSGGVGAAMGLLRAKHPRGRMLGRSLDAGFGTQ